jgi:hypothetical protein
MTAIPPSTRNTLHRFFTQSYPVISTTVSNGLENLRNSLTTDEANTDTTTGTNVDVDADIAQDESIVAISEHQMNEKWRRDNEERLKAKRLRKVITSDRIEPKLIRT